MLERHDRRLLTLFRRYWSFYLGRPTSIKRSDLGLSRAATPPSTMDEQVFNSLLDLMDLVTTITENPRAATESADDLDCAYLAMAGLHRRLKTWYTTLPDMLKWTPTRIQNAPLGYFLLQWVDYSAQVSNLPY